MGLCRFFLYFFAASAAVEELSGYAAWGAVGLLSYIIGLSYVAKKELQTSTVPYWPFLFLLSPLVIAYYLNESSYRWPALGAGVLLLGWCGFHLRGVVKGIAAPRDIGAAVGGLLAGIPLVDLLALAEANWVTWGVFIGLTLLARTTQRLIPAT
jgi:hypothetical protein